MQIAHFTERQLSAVKYSC